MSYSQMSPSNLFKPDGKVIAWRTLKEEYDFKKCMVPTVKHDGGDVKVWGCLA